MRLNKILVLLCAGASFALLAGCASKVPLVKPESEIIGQVPADPPKNRVINAEALKSESKSIAVTDTYFKKLEETRKTTGNSTSSVITPKTVEVDANKANASALTGGPNFFAFPVKFTNLADPKSTEPGTTPAAHAPDASATTNTASTDSQTQKKSGYQRNVEYGELRYLTNSILGLLIKSGYKVVQAKPSVITSNQGDEYFDILKRIKAGDFGDANYVLYGVLAEVSVTDNIDYIPGTKSTSQQVALEVTIDFNMVDTQTNQIVASFIASGDGKEIRIDGKDTGFKPSMAKLMKLASLDLAEDIRKNLASQNFTTNNPGSDGEKRNLKRLLNDDVATLKFYK